jgi:hypothetical protein
VGLWEKENRQATQFLPVCQDAALCNGLFGEGQRPGTIPAWGKAPGKSVKKENEG